MSKGPDDPSRRELLKKAVYVAPVIATLPVMSAVANVGSERECDATQRTDCPA